MLEILILCTAEDCQPQSESEKKPPDFFRLRCACCNLLCAAQVAAMVADVCSVADNERQIRRRREAKLISHGCVVLMAKSAHPARWPQSVLQSSHTTVRA